MCLSFCCIGGCPGFSCILISVSLFVRFVWNWFSKFVNILSFSDWSVFVVIFSMCRIVQLTSGKFRIQAKKKKSGENKVRSRRLKNGINRLETAKDY